MFGWLAVVSVPLKVLAVMFPVTVRLFRPVRFVVLKVPTSATPLTDRLVNWPTPVIFGWLAVVSVPLKVLAVMFLVTVRLFRPVRFVVLKVPISATPLTDRLVNCPTLVMFGWLAVVSVPLKVLAVILLVTVRLFKPVRFVVLSVPISATPLTDRLVN